MSLSSGLEGVSTHTSRVRRVTASGQDRPGVVGEVHVPGGHTHLAQDAFEEAVRAAVDVVADHDLVARDGQGRDRRRGGRPAGEGQPMPRPLQGGHGRLQPRPGGVAGARVLPPVAGPLHALLGVRARLVDRRGHGARLGVRFEARVHGQRVELPARIGAVPLQPAAGRGEVGLYRWIERAYRALGSVTAASYLPTRMACRPAAEERAHPCPDPRSP